MAMEFGPIIRKHKTTLGAIEWIKKRDSEFMSGLESSAIKENLEKTIDKDMAGFISFHLDFRETQQDKVKAFNKK